MVDINPEKLSENVKNFKISILNLMIWGKWRCFSENLGNSLKYVQSYNQVGDKLNESVSAVKLLIKPRTAEKSPFCTS